jgi:hypothetical protein
MMCDGRAASLARNVLLDTGNYYLHRDGRIAQLDSQQLLANSRRRNWPAQ